MNPLPEISHLQFLLLSCLGSDPVSGRELRSRLREFGIRKSGPAFYQLMSRLEESGFVKGEYQQSVLQGQAVRERAYRLLAAGGAAQEATRRFYAREDLVGKWSPMPALT